MVNKHFVLLLTAITIIFSSCVSKKKFLEMQSGRQRAEEKVRQLISENNAKAARIEAMIADFETMKNELLQNNAIKDTYIDSLNSEVFALNEKLNQQKESLQSTSFNFDFEKQRLSDAVQNKDRIIRQLQSQVENLEEELSQSSTTVNQKNYDINALQDKLKTAQVENQRSEERLNTLRTELKNVRAETEKLKTQLKEKDATIARLENNVKLLKQQVGN